MGYSGKKKCSNIPSDFFNNQPTFSKTLIRAYKSNFKLQNRGYKKAKYKSNKEKRKKEKGEDREKEKDK